MTTGALDLRGGALVLDDPQGLLGASLSRLLPAAAPDSPAACTLRVCQGDVPAHAPPAAQDILREGTRFHFWRTDGQRHVMVAGCAQLVAGPGRDCVLTIARDCPPLVRGELAMIALEEALHACGQALVHCAALRPPGAGGLVLVHAPSGTGKTTTALALAGAGFGLAGDDAAVLGRGADGALTAWGLPRAVNLHRRTAQMLDWLHPALPSPWPAADEISLPLSDLPAPARAVPQTLPVLALVCLQRAEGGAEDGAGEGVPPGLVPQSPGDALAALIADNIGVTSSGLWPVQMGRLDLLVTLTGQVPCHLLGVAAGPAGLQDAVAAMQAGF